VSVLIGLDVGTTNTKAVAFDPTSGEVIAVASRPTSYVRLANADEEMDPEALWGNVVACLREVTERVRQPARAVGVASMGEAGVPIGTNGQPLDRIIPWYDQRSEPQLDWVHQRIRPERLFEISGQATRCVYGMYKLLWLREHRPETFRAMRRWLSISDYVAWRLTGAAGTDYTLASRTQLFDQRARQWSPELLELVGIRAEQLPPIYPSGAPVGRVTGSAAVATGLPADIPVGIGGHDHICGSLAVGAISPGAVVDSIGTAESVVIPVRDFTNEAHLLAGRLSCFAHVVPGLYVIQGGLARGGGALEWLGHLLFAGEPDPVAVALAAAAEAPVGARQLLYFPYLGGNGAPIGDEHVSGSFVGLQPYHDRGQLVRALLEGVAYAIRATLEVIGDPARDGWPAVRAFGGGSRSPLWLQIRADVLGHPVEGIEVPEAVALGAALLAGVGAGVYSSAGQAAAAPRCPTTRYEPDAARHARYDRIYQEGYRRLYPGLKSIFAALAQPS
jgi:xylulokinase